MLRTCCVTFLHSLYVWKYVQIWLAQFKPLKEFNDSSVICARRWYIQVHHFIWIHERFFLHVYMEVSRYFIIDPFEVDYGFQC